MPGYKIDKMGEIIFANVEELSVSDVYDLACEIGKECESLIANFGPDPVNALIKKVIISLELLEKFATRNEHESAALAEYAEQVQRLEAEKEQRTENRQKFEKDIETVEEQWRREVTRLEEENKRLVAGNRESNSRGDTSSSNCPGQLDVTAELESMQRLLRHEVENHKTELKRREDELNAQQEETENLQMLVESLKANNLDAKRFQRELQAQIRSLVNERTNLISRVQDQHTEIVELKRRGPHSSVAAEPLPQPPPSFADSCGANTTNADDDDDDDDAPVQGPMPYEPEDAPWKRPVRRDSESGIRKFFRQLFLEPDKAPFHRTFETLSKMGSNSTTN